MRQVAVAATGRVNVFEFTWPVWDGGDGGDGGDYDDSVGASYTTECPFVDDGNCLQAPETTVGSAFEEVCV